MFTIRDARSPDVSQIMKIERSIAGWTRKMFQDAIRDKKRRKYVVIEDKKIIAWCLVESDIESLNVIRYAEEPTIRHGFSVLDCIFKFLIKRLKASRRYRILTVVNEEQTNCLTHMRDTDYGNGGFRAVQIWKGTFGDNVDGILMEYTTERQIVT